VRADNLPAPSVLLADRGYDADHIRTAVERRNALPVIPMRKSRKMRARMNRPLYRLRNPVERFQQAEECPPGRNPIRQDRRELPRLRQHHVDPSLATSFVNMT